MLALMKIEFRSVVALLFNVHGPDQVTNPGPLTYESGALPTALRGPAI